MGEPTWLKILAGACGGLAMLAVVWRLVYIRPMAVCGRCQNHMEHCTCHRECPACGALIAQNAKLNLLSPISLRQELQGDWVDALRAAQDAFASPDETIVAPVGPLAHPQTERPVGRREALK